MSRVVERFFPEPEQMLEMARQRAKRAEEYPAFNASWKRVLEMVDGDKELKEGIRRKLGSRGRHLVTVRGVGYKIEEESKA